MHYSRLLSQGRDALRVGRMLLSLQRSQWWSGARIRDYQRRALVAMMRHAVTHVPYYVACNIQPESIRDATDLHRFPILTKRIIQDREEELLDRRLDRASLHISRTSGSSSEPTNTYFDDYSWWLCRYALKMRRTLCAGWPLGKRVLIFGEPTGTDTERLGGPLSLGNLLYTQRKFSIFEPLTEQAEVLATFAPHIVYGAPSALAELAAYAIGHEIPLPKVPVLFTSSELLTATIRQDIEATFQGRIFDIYGSTEFKEVAVQCRYGRYHVNFESVYIESHPSEDDNADATPALLITSLANRAMPLLRFKIGDYARMGEGDCPCGRHSPYLTDIAGRQTEYLELTNGRRLSPYQITLAVETCPEVRKYQLVQQGPNWVEVQLILREDSSQQAVLEQVTDELRRVVGREVRITAQVVKHIKRTQAGKHQIIRKEVRLS